MSFPALVQSHKGLMELHGESTLVVLEEDDITGETIRVAWTLILKYETEMSQVFLAVNEQHGQRVVKRVQRSTLSANELGALVYLNASRKKHLFVHFDQWFEHFGQIYCMMEYLELGDLGAFRQTFRPPEQWIQRITRQLLQALAAMHALGYAHRDIKPSNILMASTNPPSVKVCDFGISKQLSESMGFTNTNSYTRPYAAPEVLCLDTSNIDDHVDNKVDVWALGCVVAELATGQVLFPTYRSVELFCRSLEKRNAVLSALEVQLSSEGVKFVSELLEPNPKNRPVAQDALSHSWVRTIPDTAPSSEPFLSQTVQQPQPNPAPPAQVPPVYVASTRAASRSPPEVHRTVNTSASTGGALGQEPFRHHKSWNMPGQFPEDDGDETQLITQRRIQEAIQESGKRLAHATSRPTTTVNLREPPLRKASEVKVIERQPRHNLSTTPSTRISRNGRVLYICNINDCIKSVDGFDTLEAAKQHITYHPAQYRRLPSKYPPMTLTPPSDQALLSAPIKHASEEPRNGPRMSLQISDAPKPIATRLTNKGNLQYLCPYRDCNRSINGFATEEAVIQHMGNKHSDRRFALRKPVETKRTAAVIESTEPAKVASPGRKLLEINSTRATNEWTARTKVEPREPRVERTEAKPSFLRRLFINPYRKKGRETYN